MMNQFRKKEQNVANENVMNDRLCASIPGTGERSRERALLARFFDVVNRVGGLRFAGLEEYDAKDYLFLPLYLTIGASKMRYSLRSFLVPFFAQGDDYEIAGDLEHPKTLLFFSDKYRTRKDMECIFDQVVECAPNPLALRGFHRKRINIRCIGNVWRAISWNKMLKRAGIEKYLRYFLLGQLARACNFKRFLCKNAELFSKASLSVTLFDQDFNESIFVQFCKKRGMKTAVLQHGIFFGVNEYDDCIGNYPFCYKHLVADHLLAWGEDSRQRALACGLTPERVIVVGNPKYIQDEDCCMRKTPDSVKVLGVFLDGNYRVNHSKNLHLLQMVKELCEVKGLRCLVKMHPVYAEGEEEVRSFVEEVPAMKVCDSKLLVAEIFPRVDICVSSGSSVYAEALHVGLPAFRYVPPCVPDVFAQYSLGAFCDEKSLIECFDAFFSDPILYGEKQADIANELCVPGNTAERYRLVLRALADDGLSTSEAL